MKTNKLKGSDLRIGNLIKYCNGVYRIIEVSHIHLLVQNANDINDIQNRAIQNAEPIELTEEVLLNIGFELANTKRLTGYEMVKELENNVYEFFVFKIFDNNDTILNIRKQKGGGFEYGEFIKRGVKYLHELQNAYYCLTNKELNIEL